MPARIVLLVTSTRLPAGLLSADAWDALRGASAVFTGADSAQAEAVRHTGLAVSVVDPAEAVDVLLATPDGDTAVWLAGPDGDPRLARTLGERLARTPGAAEIELCHGSWDPPGARLLDAAATMDTLRSPGGCPWDAEQTHASLLPYLVEETYEVVDAVQAGDAEGLREELGDLLLQVLFHARMAEEGAEPFTVDDVAGDLVAKLVRRHPHVFAGAEVSGAEELHATWEAVKAVEKPHRESAMDGVAMGQPALALAAKLQSRAERAGLDDEVAASESLKRTSHDPAGDRRGHPDRAFSPDSLGAQLFALVRRARAADMDAELELHRYAAAYAERMRAVEKSTSA